MIRSESFIYACCPAADFYSVFAVAPVSRDGRLQHLRCAKWNAAFGEANQPTSPGHTVTLNVMLDDLAWLGEALKTRGAKDNYLQQRSVFAQPPVEGESCRNEKPHRRKFASRRLDLGADRTAPAEVVTGRLTVSANPSASRRTWIGIERSPLDHASACHDRSASSDRVGEALLSDDSKQYAVECVTTTDLLPRGQRLQARAY